MKIPRSRYLQLQRENGVDARENYGNLPPYEKILPKHSPTTDISLEVANENSTIAVSSLLGQNLDYTDASSITTTDTSYSSLTSCESINENNTNMLAEYSQTAEQFEQNTGQNELSDSDLNEKIKITVNGIPQNIKVKVYIHPVDMDKFWLTRTYQKYENDLWSRIKRDPPTNQKWIYSCLLCNKLFKKFESLKYHLNVHLNLRPFVCKICGRPYASRLTAVKHLQQNHGILRDYPSYLGN